MTRISALPAVPARILPTIGLSQFADDAWQRMACIETANTMDDRVLLNAGASHTLAVSIGSESI